MRRLVLTLVTLLLVTGSPLESAPPSPSLRIKATPMIAFRPPKMEVWAYLRGDERAIIFGLYDVDAAGDMVLSRSSAQDLQGEKLIHVVWLRPGIGQKRLVVQTHDSMGPKETKTLDLHYLE